MKRFTLGFILLLVCLGFSSVLTAQVHTIISNDNYLLEDPQLGVTWVIVDGNSTVSWQEGTPLGFYWTYANIAGGLPEYEFRMVMVTASTAAQLFGVFEIYRNGLLVATLTGYVAGLDQPAGVGNYYKLFAGQWHLSAYIDIRHDF
jgi:hypothetical protein